MASAKNDGNYFRPQQKLDDELQHELDDALGDMSIEDIMDAETASQRPPRAKAAGAQDQPQGDPDVQLLIGTVVAIQGDDIFVDVGKRSEGVLPAGQFRDQPLPDVGDAVQVTVAAYNESEGLLMLSREGAVQAAAWATLEEGQIVEGRVVKDNKGGLELDVQGIRAFMPISQIERFHVEDIKQYLEQRLRCVVTEFNRVEKNVVVSRRDLLEIESAEARKNLLETLEEGQVLTGIVRSVMPYGAFVDLGGVDGLVHVSDMAYSRVEDPSTIVAEGQQVEVKVLKVDQEAERISLGLKQAKPDPWLGVESKWPVDSLISGRVTRLAEFGAFAEVEEGVEGLIPIGEMTFERRIKHPSEIVNEGDVVRLRVLSVEPDRRRISLSIKQAGEDPWMGASVRWPAESIVDGMVTRVADFGAFVQLSPGVDGLVHVSELSDGHVRAVTDVVREGDRVQAKVLEVDEERRRISLSIRQLATVAEYTGPAAGDEAGAAEVPPPPQTKRKRPLKGGLD